MNTQSPIRPLRAILTMLIPLAAFIIQLIRFTASHFEVLAGEKQSRFAVRMPDALPAQVDAEKHQCILVNLLSNAVKFTPDGTALLTVRWPEAAWRAS